MDPSSSPPMDPLVALPQYLWFGPAFSADSEDAPSGLEQTTQNLSRLGSLTIDMFKPESAEELDEYDTPLVDPANPNSGGYYLGDGRRPELPAKTEDQTDEIPNIPPAEAVRYLRDVAQKTFGSTIMEPLKYEFLETLGQNRKACILTITRSNGLSRSYRTKPEFFRRSDAKMAVANSAIKLGAVTFIKLGDQRASGKRRLVLAKLDASLKKEETNIPPTDGPDDGDDSVDPSVVQIEQCCLEWRAGSVTPKWIYFADAKLPDSYGCALKISLSAHLERSYFVPVSVEYQKKSPTKAACARAALEQDVLEFIKHGDGLENPISVPIVSAEVSVARVRSMMTLQAYQDSLPQPFPDTITTKNNGELNALAWVNTLLQNAKGSRMTLSFYWHTNIKLGLHGCLLNLARPDAPHKSYLVDAIFSKRADAKIAVCLYACSQGIGDYVRNVAAEIHSRVTPEMRNRSMVQIIPPLSTALSKIRIGLKPSYQFECELASYACTMTMDLSEPDAEVPIKKEWKVPMGYKSRADAKTAVLCAAADDGLMTFVTSRGKVEVEGAMDVDGEADMVLEEGEAADDAESKKKRKKNKKTSIDNNEGKKDGETSENKGEGRGRGRFTASTFRRRPQFRRGGGFGRGRGQGAPIQPNVDAHFSGDLSAYPGYTPPSYPPAFSHYSTPSQFPAPGIPPLLPPSPVAYPHAWDPYSHDYVHYDPGQPMAEPGPAQEQALYGFGGASADTATSFANAPPSVRPFMAPAYNGYQDQGYIPEHYGGNRDDPNSYLQPPYADIAPWSDHQSQSQTSFSPPPFPPYDPYYSANDASGVGAEGSYFDRNDIHRDMPLEHDMHAALLAHSHPRAYSPDHYAPEYDRIPERGVAPPYPPSGSRFHSAMQPEFASQSQFQGGDAVENADGQKKLPPTGPRAMRLAESRHPPRPESATLGKPVPSDVLKRGRSEAAETDDNLLPNKRPRVQSPTVQREFVESDKQSDTLKRLREQALRTQKRQRTGNDKDKSYVTTLFDLCAKENLPRPEICHQEVEAVEGGVTSKAFKVWIIMGNEKMELPTSFATVDAGKERVAKSVLGRLKLQLKSKLNT